MNQAAPAGTGKDGRILCLQGLPMAAGDVVRHAGTWRTIEGFGRPFRANRAMARRLSLNIEGEYVRYAYTRPATPEEALRKEAEERQLQRDADRDHRLRAAVAALSGAPLALAGEVPNGGRQIWSEDVGGTVHASRRVILDDDMMLWFIDHDARDGRRYGGNMGEFTIARKLAATEDLLTAFGVTLEAAPADMEPG